MLDTSKIKTKWDLTPLLSDEDNSAIKKELEILETRCIGFVEKWKGRDDYLISPKILAQALIELEQLESQGWASGNVGYYFDLKSALYQDSPTVKAKNSKVEEKVLQLSAELEFFAIRVSRISQDLQQNFLDEPGVQPYKHWLERRFSEGKYRLSEGEEKILTLSSTLSYGNWVKMTAEFIDSEEKEVLNEKKEKVAQNFSDILNLLSNPDITVRESAANAIDEVFDKHSKVAEAEMNSVLMAHKLSDKLRGFTRPDAARHQEDDIDTEIVDTLINTVEKNYKIVHEYYALKAKLLNLPNLKYYERNISFNDKGLEKTYSFERAVKLVHKSLNNLSPDFAEIFEKYLYNGQMDVFSRKGKASYEFCAGGSKSQPVYVMLNYGGKLEDVSTVAHEMGHAINDELSKISQNALLTETPLCLAETASTFFEDLILDELEETLTDDVKLALSIFRLDSAMNAVFRQVACYKFEQDLHETFREKGFLSKDDIGESFIKHMSAYCGPGVEMLTGSKNWWLHWSHIRFYFYVYTYAFGFLVSKNFQRLVRKDNANMEKIKTFLSAGGSKSPQLILEDIGIDISKKEFWRLGIEEIANDLKEATELAERLGKIPPKVGKLEA